MNQVLSNMPLLNKPANGPVLGWCHQLRERSMACIIAIGKIAIVATSGNCLERISAGWAQVC